jgi:hypothetical protein
MAKQHRGKTHFRTTREVVAFCFFLFFLFFSILRIEVATEPETGGSEHKLAAVSRVPRTLPTQ